MSNQYRLIKAAFGLEEGLIFTKEGDMYIALLYEKLVHSTPVGRVLIGADYVETNPGFFKKILSE